MLLARFQLHNIVGAILVVGFSMMDFPSKRNGAWNPRTSGYPCDSKTTFSSSYYLRLRPDNRTESFFMFFLFLVFPFFSHKEKGKTINIVGDRFMLNVVVGGARRRRRRMWEKRSAFSSHAHTMPTFSLPCFLPVIRSRTAQKITHNQCAVNIK